MGIQRQLTLLTRRSMVYDTPSACVTYVRALGILYSSRLLIIYFVEEGSFRLQHTREFLVAAFHGLFDEALNRTQSISHSVPVRPFVRSFARI